MWGKAINKSRERIAKQLDDLWDYTQKLTEQELTEDKPDFEQVDSKKVSETIDKIDERLYEIQKQK